MATTSGILTDTTLENLKQWVFSEATQAYERQIGKLEEANKQLGSFQSDIDARVKELQDGRIPMPGQEALVKEAGNFVETYDRLYIEALKAQKLAGELSHIIEYLTPRVIVDEATMVKRGGDLAKASKLTDEACMRHIQSLKDCQGKVETLQIKMLEEISLKTTPAVQNFGAIVERVKKASNSLYESFTSWFTAGVEKPANFTSVGDKLDDFRTETSLLNVANAPLTAGKHPLIDITFEVLKQEVFNEVTQAYERQIGSIQKANKELGAFEREVKAETSPLQNGRISIPSQDYLLKKQIEFVSTYDRLYIEAFKAQKLAGELKRVIEFLTPKIIIDEATLKAHGGQLAKVSQLTDAACREHIASLTGYQGKVDTLQTQMVTQILGSTAWSVQRFCQIVDNKGNPLNLLTRVVDKYTWAAVPELANVQGKLEASAKGGVLPSLPSSPALNSAGSESPEVPDPLVGQGTEPTSSEFEIKDKETPVAPNILVEQGSAPIPSAPESQGERTPAAPDALIQQVSKLLNSSDAYDEKSPPVPAALAAQPIQLPPGSEQEGTPLPNGQVLLSPVL